MKQLLFALFLGVFALFPQLSFAQSTSTCDCFCKTSGGAVRVSKETNADACKATCKEKSGHSFLGCYDITQSSSRPENNRICYTRAECEEDLVPLQDGTEGPSEWGRQASECLPGSGYCYAPKDAALASGGSATVRLNVPIGGLTEVSDLGTYVAAIYSFLLIAGAVIAILVFMIAGLQYTMAGGNSGAISKAKERMGAAVVGMVLLLGAYTIAYIIDPRLVRLDPFRIPKVKQVLYLSQSNDCDYLIETHKLNVAATGPMQCGGGGIVTAGQNPEQIKAMESMGIEAGHKCVYSHCPDGKTCLQDGNNAYKCVSCNDITGALGGFGVPNERVCASLTATPKSGEVAFCTYFDAAIGNPRFDSCVELAYPKTDSQHTIDCAKLKEDYGSEKCGAYDWVLRRQDVSSINVSVDSFVQQIEPLNKDEYRRIFELICNPQDICGLGGSAGCKVEESGWLLGYPLDQFNCVDNLLTAAQNSTDPACMACNDCGLFCTSASCSALGKCASIMGTFGVTCVPDPEQCF